MENIASFLAPLAPILGPFILNSIIGGIKKLIGNEALRTMVAKNGLLRSILLILSVVGIIAGHMATGNPIDFDSIKEILTLAAQTFALFVASHGSYSLFFKKKVE